MTLDELIRLPEEDFINYDFKKEIFNLRHLPYDNQNTILNIIFYKGNIYGAHSDCDRLPLTLEVYEKLWGNNFCFWDDEKQNNFVEANGETMNSFVTPYKSLYKENHSPNSSSIDKLFKEYAILTHTIGNFIPVYAEKTKNGWASPFNGPRYRSTFDYWDLTLYHIKEFFNLKKHKNMSKEKFSKYVSSIEKNDITDEEWVLTKAYIVNSKEWLLSYSTWENFVKMNFLKSFLVDPNDLSSDPKEFWTGHFQGKVKTNNEKDIETFLSIVNESIKARSRLILIDLKSLE